MSSTQSMQPEFGTCVPGERYVDRPGAYGLALEVSRGLVLTVRTPSGCYLPGGGSDPDECDRETLEREFIEELGCTVEVLERLGDATEYVRADGDGCFAKRCAFYAVRVGRKIAEPIELDHEARWLATCDARSRLTHGSQRWALDLLLHDR